MLNSSNQIVAANDYDCWGYPLENRSYQSDDIDYKFTGKQRDAETGYDYFGARYYDARIANWGSVDPLLEKHIGWNPYNYVLRNPIALIDPDGKQVNFSNVKAERNEQLINYRLAVDPKVSQYINYTVNDKGDYILDIESLNEVLPSNIKDPVLTILMSVANNNMQVELGYRNPDEPFHENQRITFDDIEGTKGKDAKSFGHTFVSGEVKDNPEKPQMISVTGRNSVYINRKYGNAESVKTIPHELLHVLLYNLGCSWGDKSYKFDERIQELQSRAAANRLGNLKNWSQEIQNSLIGF